MVRLRTLESIWIQESCVCGAAGPISAVVAAAICLISCWHLGKITKTAINDALRRMKKSGISKPELEAFFQGVLVKIKVGWHSALMKRLTMMQFSRKHWFIRSQNLLCAEDRYIKRLSKKAMARDLNKKHPEWCLRTCEKQNRCFG
jgi:hypothetical protein